MTGDGETDDQKWCARCMEEFPEGESDKRFTMGKNYPLKLFPKKFREHHEVRNRPGKYLCGNCYFDLLDIMEGA